ncbi:MAG: diguanylate cyclase [Rhodocyclaceae bacterium]|nr:diguanylate cyclase [Rhodocyclaceae bacterium]
MSNGKTPRLQRLLHRTFDGAYTDAKNAELCPDFANFSVGVAGCCRNRVFQYQTYQADQAIQHNRINRNLGLMQRTAETSLEKLARDAEFIAHSPVLKLYLQDPQAANKARAEDALLTLSALRKDYEQTRYIDQDGREQIRVDRAHTNGESSLRTQGLQDKSSRPYVQAGLQLAAGKVFISDFDLNVEFNRIEIPYKPVLRTVVPVVLDQRRKGMIVLNSFAGELLAQLQATLPENEGEVVIMSESGGWISGSPDLNWQYLIQPAARLSVQDSELWSGITARRNGQFEHGGECYHFVWFQAANSSIQAAKWLFAEKTKNQSCSASLVSAIESAVRRIALILLVSVPILLLWHRSRLRNEYYKQELEDKQAALSTIAKEAGHALIMVDSRCQVQWMNAEAQRLLGWSEADLIGKSLHDSVHLTPEGTPVHPGQCATLQSLATGEPQSKEHDRMLSRSGELLHLSTRVTPFGGADRRQAIVSLVDIASHVALEESLTIQAEIDELTQTLNRRAILQHLQAALSNSAPASCILALDIDFFKSVNDKYGHLVGDEILIHFCRTIETMLRKNDLLGRIGGEEFIIVAHTGSMADAMGLAERVRTVVANTPYARGADPSIAMTVSIGVAQPRPDETVKELLARADEALYRAKDSGRNRVVSAD